jgi:hypothetical protein
MLHWQSATVTAAVAFTAHQRTHHAFNAQLAVSHCALHVSNEAPEGSKVAGTHATRVGLLASRSTAEQQQR